MGQGSRCSEARRSGSIGSGPGIFLMRLPQIMDSVSGMIADLPILCLRPRIAQSAGACRGRRELAARDAELTRAQDANARLWETLRQLRRTQFGRKSEKLDPDQLNRRKGGGYGGISSTSRTPETQMFRCPRKRGNFRGCTRGGRAFACSPKP